MKIEINLEELKRSIQVFGAKLSCMMCNQLACFRFVANLCVWVKNVSGILNEWTKCRWIFIFLVSSINELFFLSTDLSESLKNITIETK